MTTILVVDDDSLIRSALARGFTDQGMRVETAQSVEDAIGVLSRTSVDVLVTDLRMGERDGIDLLGAVRRISPHTRAVLMSAYATARDYQTAIELGAVRVLCKPFTPTEAFDAVRQAVECEKGFRGSIHGLSLVDVLQMFHYGRRSITIAIAGVVTGSIHLREGEVIHARYGDLEGYAALKPILATQSGSMTTSVLADVPRTITADFQGLILDLLRELDEASFTRDPSKPPARFTFTPDAGPDVPELDAELVARIAQLEPESAIALLDARRRAVIEIAGAGFEEDVIDAAVQVVRGASRLAPQVTKVEFISDDVAYAILAQPDGEPVAIVANALVGRYAPLRFRSESGRIASVMSLFNWKGAGDGQDR